MDPKQLSEFIARHGTVTGQKTNPKKSLREPETITLEFADGASVTYQQAQVDPDTGEELSPFKIVSSNETKATTSGGSAAQETISAPSNQQYISRTGPKDAQHPDGIYWYPNPNYVPPATGANAKGTKTELVTGPGGNTDVVTWEIEPDGSKGRIVEQRPATKAEIENARGPQPTSASGTQREEVKPGIFKVTTASKKSADGTTTEDQRVHYEDAQGNIVPMPQNAPKNEPRLNPQTGRYEVTEYDAQGNPTGVKEVPRGETLSRPSTAPTLPPGTHLGTISTALQAVAQRIVDDPNMTPQEKNNSLDQLAKFGTTFTQETGQILGAQQNVFNNETSQRNTNIQDAASRRNFASGLVSDSFKDVSSLKTPVGSGLAGPAFVARVMLGLTLADKLGGLKTFPDVQQGLAQQQAMGLSLPGMEQQPQQAQPQVQAQPQPQGAMPTINIINGVPQQSEQPQWAQQALPQVPGGGFLPPGSPINFSDGQLRAPGYRANEDTPAWAADMFQ